jgi:peptide/nickel transport system ATP-binding protein
MKKILEVRDVDVVYSGKPALRGLSLAVGGPRPSITAVVGESGSGKTTLIRLLLGFQDPSSGSVLYDGKPLTSLRGTARRDFRRDVQAIFQDPFDVFNPFYRIDHPLLTPLRAFRLVRSREEAYARIEKTLKRVGLDPAETLGRYPHQLSGGQRQRVMIARALLLDPEVILADEPVSMVDASMRSTILEILYGLNRDLGISLIYVTHDLTTAYQVADTIVVLHGGQVMEVGAAEDVIHRPRHPYTQALIEAVPSPDPDKPWNLDETIDGPGRYLPGEEKLALYQTDPLRAVAAPLRPGEETTTAAAIQLAVSEAKAAGAAVARHREDMPLA